MTRDEEHDAAAVTRMGDPPELFAPNSPGMPKPACRSLNGRARSPFLRAGGWNHRRPEERGPDTPKDVGGPCMR